MENKAYKLSSLTAKDFRWDFYSAGGKGGQRRDRKATACRCVHEPSGAVGISQDERSQLQNKQLAFKRMAESDKFQKWLKVESSRLMGNPTPEFLAEISVDKMMNKMHDFKIEIQVGKNEWKVVSLEEFLLLPTEVLEDTKIRY